MLFGSTRDRLIALPPSLKMVRSLASALPSSPSPSHHLLVGAVSSSFPQLPFNGFSSLPPERRIIYLVCFPPSKQPLCVFLIFSLSVLERTIHAGPFTRSNLLQTLNFLPPSHFIIIFTPMLPHVKVYSVWQAILWDMTGRLYTSSTKPFLFHFNFLPHLTMVISVPFLTMRSILRQQISLKPPATLMEGGVTHVFFPGPQNDLLHPLSF